MSLKRIHFFREIVIVLVLSLVLVSSLNIKTVNAQAGQVMLKPSDDTYVDSSNSNSNYGGQNILSIQNYQEAILNQTYKYESIVWLKFDLSSIPDGAEVDGAALQLFANSVAQTFNVHACSCSDNSWTEMALTYLNMPSYNATSKDTAILTTEWQLYNWSVVDIVGNALENHAKAVTIVLLDPSLHVQNSSSPISRLWFYSKEAGQSFSDERFYPKLAIHWSGVVAEFPTFLVLPLLMIATLLAVIIYRKKHAKIP